MSVCHFLHLYGILAHTPVTCKGVQETTELAESTPRSFSLVYKTLNSLVTTHRMLQTAVNAAGQSCSLCHCIADPKRRPCYHTPVVAYSPSSHAAVLGFFVPYFDLDVILFPTPPCHTISSLPSFPLPPHRYHSPNPAPRAPNGTSRRDNPARAHPSPSPPNAAAHYAPRPVYTP
jgi:hypothetical protein